MVGVHEPLASTNKGYILRILKQVTRGLNLAMMVIVHAPLFLSLRKSSSRQRMGSVTQLEGCKKSEGKIGWHNAAPCLAYCTSLAWPVCQKASCT